MAEKQISCDNGHYYLESLGSCPICKYEGKSGTVMLDIGDSKAYTPSEIKDTKLDKRMRDAKTQYIASTKESSVESAEQDVVLAGWLIIISSKGKGKSYHVTFGFNSIGRGEANHICINNNDNSISREKHASVIYDYSNNIYFLKHESGKFLTYLNNEVVLETKKIKSFDTIKVGNTKLLFVALCGDEFKWDE